MFTSLAFISYCSFSSQYFNVMWITLPRSLECYDDARQALYECLCRMKKNYRETCEDIKLTKSKLAETDHNLEKLRSHRARLRRHISVKDRDLKIDVAGCLPLRSSLNIDTRGGPIVKIPFLHSS